MKKSSDPYTPEELKAKARPTPTERDGNGLPMPAAPAPAGVHLQGFAPAQRGQAQPPLVGDFAGDLGPGHQGGVPRPAGNLMGPDHPMFQAGPSLDQNPDDDFRSGFGMRPRFDPFGPPGGPQQINPPGRGGPPAAGGRQGGTGGGEPNPDHLPPPNSLGDNDSMFS